MVLVENPTAQNWYDRGVEHMQQGRRHKALLCWEEAVSLEPSNEGYREAADNLRNALFLSPFGQAYHALKETIRIQREVSGSKKKADVDIFNLPGLLGTAKLSPEEFARLKELTKISPEESAELKKRLTK